MNSPQTARGECCAKRSVSKNIKQYLLLGTCFFGTISTIRAQIYDCFLFYNELEILTIRLHELYDHVDKFVLVESEETFRGNQKPLYYQENKHLFEKFADKIIHVVVEGHYEAKNKETLWAAWEREFYQRDQIMRGLNAANEKDIIMICDVDEIVRSSTILEIQNMIDLVPPRQFKCIVSMLTYYGYYFNRFDATQTPWFGPVAVYYENLKKYSPCHFRKLRNRGFPLKNAGWHLSYMGGFERVVNKITAISTVNIDTPENKDRQNIRKKIDLLSLVAIDESFPRIIYENQQEYEKKGFIDLPASAPNGEKTK